MERGSYNVIMLKTGQWVIACAAFGTSKAPVTFTNNFYGFKIKSRRTVAATRDHHYPEFSGGKSKVVAPVVTHSFPRL